jgi:hypothetical protein
MGEEMQIGVGPGLYRAMKGETYEVKQRKRSLSTPRVIFILFDFGWCGRAAVNCVSNGDKYFKSFI